MKTNKKNPRKQLENFSNIFLQLGLVLTLFLVFIGIEHPIAYQIEDGYSLYQPDEQSYVIEEQPPLVFSKDIPKTIAQSVAKTPVIELQPIKNMELIDYSSVIEPSDSEDKPIITSNTIKEVTIEEPISNDDNPKTLKTVDQALVFSGCEHLSKEDRITCLDRKLKRLVQRHFDSNLANELGLKPENHKIMAQFIIDEKVDVVNVNVRAPHQKLKSETLKVISKIPQFTPGRQNGELVKVRYRLPIIFKVE